MARSLENIEIRNRMLRRLNSLGFNSMSTGSLVRSFADIWAEETSQVLEDIDYISSQYLISNANGAMLDLLGRLVGLTRIAPTQSSVAAEDSIVKFYASTGLLSDYLPAATLPGFKEIPAGTVIATSDNTILYDVPQTLVPEGVSQVYVSATARSTGTINAVPANSLTNHNLNIDSVLVTNTSAISNGTDLETDDNFRYRISKSRTTAAKANETAVRLAVLTTPGVADAELKPNAFGPGTFDILIIPEGNIITEETKSLVESNISDVVAFGSSVRISEPNYLPMNMVVQIILDNKASSVTENQAISSAESVIFDYLSNINMGGTFSPAQQERLILRANENIINAEIILLCIDGKPVPASNYVLNRDELFIPDPQLSVPIQVLV